MFVRKNITFIRLILLFLIQLGNVIFHHDIGQLVRNQDF